MTVATFSTVEAAELSGATYRMVDHWCTHGVLGSDHAEPLGSGRRRRFSAEDVFVLRVIQRCAAAHRTFSKGAVPGVALYADIACRVRAGHRHVVLQHLAPHVLLVVEIDDLSPDPAPVPVKPAPTLETPA